MKRLVLSLVLATFAATTATAVQQPDVHADVQTALKASGVYAKCQQMMTGADTQRLQQVLEREDLDTGMKRAQLRRHAKRVCGKN